MRNRRRTGPPGPHPHLRLLPTSAPEPTSAEGRRVVAQGLAAHLQTLLAAGDYAAAHPVAELLATLLRSP